MAVDPTAAVKAAFPDVKFKTGDVMTISGKSVTLGADGKFAPSQLPTNNIPPVAGGSAGASSGGEPDRSVRHPKTSYSCEYYYNKKTTTESGHEMEWDDTPGKERIRCGHKSGTYYEISAGGDKVDNIVGKEHKYNKGGFTQTVDNNTDIKYNGNMRVSIGKAQHIEINGTKTETIAAEMALAVQKGASIVIIEDLYIVCKNLTIQTGENINLEAGGDMAISAGGNINMKAGKGMSVKADGGDIRTNSSADTVMTSGGQIKLN
jgi:hypothetical protein